MSLLSSGLISVAAILSRYVSPPGSSPGSSAGDCRGVQIKQKSLWIEHGARLYLLDLKQGKEFNDDPQPLPIIYSTRLFDSDSLPDQVTCGTEEPVSLYHLWINECDLSLRDLVKVPKLKKSMMWPVVEKIDNVVHVMESIPNGNNLPPWTPKHEFLDLDDHGLTWIEVSPMLSCGEFPSFMCGHLVLGDQILAIAHRTPYNEYFLFDCKTMKWTSHKCSGTKPHLTEYNFEYSICIERFYMTGYESPFYLVIKFDNIRTDDVPQVSAEALGITAAGYIHWSQSLPMFFEGLAPMALSYAHVFRVDEKMMCVVMVAKQTSKKTKMDYSDHNIVYISTFFVEESSQWQEGGVKVVLKERHIYNAGEEDFPIMVPRLRACFR